MREEGVLDGDRRTHDEINPDGQQGHASTAVDEREVNAAGRVDVSLRLQLTTAAVVVASALVVADVEGDASRLDVFDGLCDVGEHFVGSQNVNVPEDDVAA